MAPIFFDYPRGEQGRQRVRMVLATFETYLARTASKFATGATLTLADLALVSATLCVEAIEAQLLDDFKLVKQWYAMFKREHPALWQIGAQGMAEIVAFDKNRPDLSQMKHPIHPVRKN